MIKKSISNKTQADTIKNVAKLLNENSFLYFIDFADTLIRFQELTGEKGNLSWLRGKVLHYLILKGGKMTPTSLARLTFRSKHSMTTVIDTLVKEGLVKRNVGHKEDVLENNLSEKSSANIDRRFTFIEVTPAGLEYVRKSTQRAAKWESQVTSCLTADESQTLIELTERLRKTMAAIIKDLLSK